MRRAASTHSCQGTAGSLIFESERVQGLRLALRPPAKHLPWIHRAAAAATPGALLAIHHPRSSVSHRAIWPRSYRALSPQPRKQSLLQCVVLPACSAPFDRNAVANGTRGVTGMRIVSNIHEFHIHACEISQRCECAIASVTAYRDDSGSSGMRCADAEHGYPVTVRTSAHAIPAEVFESAGGAQGAAHDGRALHVSVRAQRGRVGGGGELVAGVSLRHVYGCPVSALFHAESRAARTRAAAKTVYFVKCVPPSQLRTRSACD